MTTSISNYDIVNPRNKHRIVAVSDLPETALGAVIYWSVVPIAATSGPVELDRNVLIDRLERSGALTGIAALVPRARQDATLLGRAVKHVVVQKNRERLTHATEDGSIAILDVDRGEKEVNTTQRAVVFIDKESKQFMTRVDIDTPETHDMLAAIRAEYDRLRPRLAAHDVTSGFLPTVLVHLQALRLRDAGGVYFIPASALYTWRRLIEQVDACFDNGELKCAEIPAVDHASATAAILDALRTNVENAVTELEQEIETLCAEMGVGATINARSIRTRQERISTLYARVQTYARITGDKLDDLNGQIAVLSDSLNKLSFVTPPEA